MRTHPINFFKLEKECCLMVKSRTVEPGYLGLTPVSATFWLCNLVCDVAPLLLQRLW